MLKVPRVNNIVLTKAGANPDIINVCANIKSKAIGNGMNVPMKEIRLKLARLMGTPINLSKLHAWLATAPNTPAKSMKGVVLIKMYCSPFR